MKYLASRGRRRVTALRRLLALCLASPLAGSDGWFDFAPPADPASTSVIDLRHLNEEIAGADGFVRVHDGHFALAGSDAPVRFWAVNGPSSRADTPEALRREARILAAYGINLVRVHGPLYDTDGTLDPAKVQRYIEIADAMRQEGIYVLYSIYFPLWLKPRADHPWLAGYDGEQHPFAALMFNEEFQRHYQEWWRALLLTPSERTGRRLIDEPSVMGLEIQNEDSYFFWTFSDQGVPPPQRHLLEQQFARWLEQRYGSLSAATAAWENLAHPHDAPEQGRMGFRSLSAITQERTQRDQDTVAFLYEHQRAFYRTQSQFLRGLGFRGLITCSNWITASPELLGPIEKLSYTEGDFIDRHGYFSVRAQGEGAAWSIRPDQTFRERSALRFEPEVGNTRVFVHPAMDPKYAGLPSMISETTWNRPNRYRSEAPLYFAAYGALQDTDAIVHFAFDGSSWSVKPNYWMQPWTLMTPAMMGQFPAAALIYRAGLIQPGAVVAEVNLNEQRLLALEGTPLPQDAALDELRLKDMQDNAAGTTNALLDPLLHYVGRANVAFSGNGPRVQTAELGRYIDRANQRVTSTHGELTLDYGAGILRLAGDFVHGASGNLRAAGEIDLPHLRLHSPLDLAHVVLVPLDGQPIARSQRLLLQVMSEEQPTGYVTAPAPEARLRIASVGTDPWQVKQLTGTVRFKGFGENLKVTALDHQGTPTSAMATRGGELQLQRDTLYYLVER